MAGPRITETKSTAVTNRFPQWSDRNYYDTGSVVWAYDSEMYLHTYMAVTNHISNDSDANLFSDNWWHWLTDGPVDSDELSWAALQKMVRHLKYSYDSDYPIITAYPPYLRNLLDQVLPPEDVDSEALEIDSDLRQIEPKPILTIDSDSEINGTLLSWDSDAHVFVTKPAILKINGAYPDIYGNVPVVLAKISYGTLDAKPDSELNGAIYIIDLDSDSEANGRLYIFSNGSWDTLVVPNRKINDKKYIKVSGGSIDSDFIVLEPILNDHPATKYYVENNGISLKQDIFHTADSDSVIDLTQVRGENFVVTREQPVIRFYDQSTIRLVGEYDPLYQFSKPMGVAIVGNTLVINTNRFSSYLEYKIELKKNGSLEPFTIGSNIVGVPFSTGVVTNARLLDHTSQIFTIDVVLYDPAAEYILSVTTDTGDIETLTKLTGSSVWTPNSENFDFGTY